MPSLLSNPQWTSRRLFEVVNRTVVANNSSDLLIEPGPPSTPPPPAAAEVQQHYQAEYYLILCQLVVGLTVNVIMLCSMAVVIRQKNHSTIKVNYVHQKCSTMPVIDIIVGIICWVATLRILLRCAIQFACYYGKWNDETHLALISNYHYALSPRTWKEIITFYDMLFIIWLTIDARKLLQLLVRDCITK